MNPTKQVEEAAGFTPAMRQYLAIKQEYPDSILLYRMGDFYEMFFEDAKTASRILSIALTSRDRDSDNPTPMCGFPYHAAQSYIAKLINENLKVAVCEQVEDPKLAKGLVKREVVRVITPGTVLELDLLDARDHNYIMAVHHRKSGYGLAYLDLSTGDFAIAQFSAAAEDEVGMVFEAVAPRELVVPEAYTQDLKETLFSGAAKRIMVNQLPDYSFGAEAAADLLRRHFGVASLQGFGCENLPLAVGAAGALLQYLQETQKTDLSHLQRLRIHRLEGVMILDQTAQRNLELTKTLINGSRAGTLLDLLDKTVTPMGGRTLKSWLLQPLAEVAGITERQDLIAALLKHGDLFKAIRQELESIYDLERLNSRICMEVASPRDLAAVRSSLTSIPKLKAHVRTLPCEAAVALADDIDALEEIFDLLHRAIVDDPPFTVREGGIIRSGYDPEVDELQTLARSGKETILAMERKEREQTGISKLKIGYNKVFGFYLEISKSYLAQVPPHYIRKQTLVNAERFITEELKDYEEKVIGAEAKIVDLEYRIFQDIRKLVANESARILKLAAAVGKLDALASLALVADLYAYSRPVVSYNDSLKIVEGRHPVVERINLEQGFIPNDTELDNRDNQIMIITGPNMAGKSTYIRQVALIVILAQMGSYVPAASAEIGVVDRIFTRVGAADNLYGGLSTFMVEMTETSNILHNATPKSLIILDEVGRGTSTFDGMSLAWAIVEFIHDNHKVNAKTLFATHYHELTELAASLPRVKNFNVAVKEWNDQIIFLRKIYPGGADRSYGIQVARLAGIPLDVIDRAKEILINLEAYEFDVNGKPSRAQRRSKRQRKEADNDEHLKQLDLFGMMSNPVIKELEQLDVNTITPVEAITILARLKARIGG